MALNAAKVVCLNGHALNGVNLYVPANGSRQCKQCRRDRKAKYRAQGVTYVAA